jgi:energy-coupling factor transporter transmembrane protein EcfT
MVDWSWVINRMLLASVIVVPIVMSILLIIVGYVANIPLWKTVLLIALIAPVLLFIFFYNWSWYSTEGSGPVE